MSQMEINSQRQSLLSIPQNGAEQKISQQRRLKLFLNDDIFLTEWCVPTIPDYFPFCITNKYTSVSFHWMVVCVKRLIRGRIVMGPSCAIFILFLSPFKPSLMCFSFVVCVSKDRSFEASHWRPAEHVRPPDANFSCPPLSYRLQPFSASELKQNQWNVKILILFFSCPGQLNRWPCHWVSQ